MPEIRTITLTDTTEFDVADTPTAKILTLRTRLVDQHGVEVTTQELLAGYADGTMTGYHVKQWPDWNPAYPHYGKVVSAEPGISVRVRDADAPYEEFDFPLLTFHAVYSLD
jgi:hypothetical protein